MTTYVVIDRAVAALQDPPIPADAPVNPARIYTYVHTEPISLQGMEFDTHDHVPVPDAPAPINSGLPPVATLGRRVTKLQFVALLGDDFNTLLDKAKIDINIEMFMVLISWATPDPDLTSIDRDDIRVIQGLGYCELMNYIAPGRAAEILGGI